MSSSVSLPTTCQLTCQNGGYCNFVSSDPSTLRQIFTSGGLIQKCICPTGFSGIACETVVEECQLPALTCHNGIPCSLNLQGEWDGHYVCDCSAADALSKFAGSMCRNPATTYCGGGEITNRSFCTNGGLCLENLMGGYDDDGNVYDTHKGCRCPTEFEGEHCEYVKGMAPSKQKESDNANRAYVTDVQAVIAESSPALTSSHSKNSKEMAASNEEGTEPNQSTVSVANDANDSSVSVSKDTSTPNSNTIESETISHSKNSILQSNNVVAIQQPTKSVTQPIQSITASTANDTHSTTNTPNPGSVIGLIISVMGITLFGTAILLRNRRQRQQRSKIIHNHTSANHLASLDRNNYTDETPIRVRIMAEDEDNDLELDEVLGEDDDVVSIGECSLEEIELEESGADGTVTTYGEYLRNISDEFEDGERSSGSEGSGYFPNIFA